MGPDLFVSYRSQNGRVRLLTYSDTPSPSHSVLDLDDTTGPTSVAAFGGQVLAVYEYAYPGGNGIKGQMSYDGGATWSIEDIAVPTAGEAFSRPAWRGGAIRAGPSA